MIFVKCEGGFGDHLKRFIPCYVLSKKFKLDICVISNQIPNDTDSKRHDTRTSLIKILGYKQTPSVIDNEEYAKATGTDRFFTTFTEKGTETFNLVRAFRPNLPTWEWPWELNGQEILTLKNDSEYFSCENIMDTMDTTNTTNTSNIIFDFFSISNISWYLNKIPREFFGNKISKINPETIVISVRVGMGNSEVNPVAFSNIQGSLRIPFSFYRKAIEFFGKYDKILICCDNFESDYLSQFSIFERCYYMKNLSTLDQFRLMVFASRIISSNSSFSLMAAVISNATVILPKIENHDPIPSLAYGKLDGVNETVYPKNARFHVISTENS